jgi:hypothetical protein
MLSNKVKAAICKLRGWKTFKRIVVIESDDWGMIRTSSKASFDRLSQKGYPLQKSIYASNDAFETTTDVQRLAACLLNFKNAAGNTPKFTLNNVLFNPDFHRIEYENFQAYHRQIFTETAKEYSEAGLA